MGRKKIYFVHIGYIPRPSVLKLHISRQNLDKVFNLQPQNLCLYQLTKNLAADIDPHISTALRDPQLGNIFVVFVGCHSNVYCSGLSLPILYIPE